MSPLPQRLAPFANSPSCPNDVSERPMEDSCRGPERVW